MSELRKFLFYLVSTFFYPQQNLIYYINGRDPVLIYWSKYLFNNLIIPFTKLLVSQIWHFKIRKIRASINKRCELIYSVYPIIFLDIYLFIIFDFLARIFDSQISFL